MVINDETSPFIPYFLSYYLNTKPCYTQHSSFYIIILKATLIQKYVFFLYIYSSYFENIMGREINGHLFLIHPLIGILLLYSH